MSLFLYCAVYTTLELSSCLLVYLLIFRARMEERKWLVGGSLLAVIGVTYVYARATNTDYINLIVDVLGIVIPIVWLREKGWKWIALYPVCFMCFSTLQTGISFLVAEVIDISYVNVTAQSSVILLIEGGAFLVLFLVYEELKRRGALERNIYVSKGQYIIFFIGVFSSIVILGITQMLCKEDGMVTSKVRDTMGMIVSIFCISYFLVSLWNLLLVQSRMEYKHLAETYELFARQQEQQIQAVLNSDEQLRRYRHDMRAHLMTLQAMSAAGGQNGELNQYLQEILNRLEAIQTRNYTGNSAVDAILGNLVYTAEKEGIEVVCNARLTEQPELAAFDLCTVLSNLIQNAIEACRELIEEGRRAEMEIGMYPMEEHLLIRVKNPTAHEVQIRNGELITTKKDAKNHGLGSKNVKSVVEKYGGTLQYECQDGVFTAEVYL